MRSCSSAMFCAVEEEGEHVVEGGVDPLVVLLGGEHEVEVHRAGLAGGERVGREVEFEHAGVVDDV